MKMVKDKKKLFVFAMLALCFFGYSVFLYANPPAAVGTGEGRIVEGKRIWQKYNCNACHQVYGLGGFLGPDLTNVYGKGAGYIKAFLQNGTQVMPDFKLSEEEKNDLVAYLRYLDRLGKADPRTFKILRDGSIKQ